jgi:two-component system sensor histidine kinase KdpD
MQNPSLPTDTSARAGPDALGGAVLACVGHGPGAARVLDAARRLAQASGVAWHAVLVETARTRRLHEDMRLRALALLRQAQAGGAVSSVLEGEDPAAALGGYARRHGCNTVVLVREQAAALPWRAPLARRLTAILPELDVVEVAAGAQAPPGARQAETGAAPGAGPRAVLAGAGASLATALAALPLLPLLDLANVAMLFLLSVVLVAIRLGRAPAVAATLVCFCALVLAAHWGNGREYDVSEFKYAVALGVMLAVGWITARLTADLREQAEGAVRREARTRALYEFARALSAALQTAQVFEITLRFLERSFDARGAILLPDAGCRWPAPAADAGLRGAGAQRAGHGRRPVGLRPRQRGRRRHQHLAQQPLRLPAAGGADAYPRRAGLARGGPGRAAGA